MAPESPRPRVKIDQEVNRRLTVAGACGWSTRSSPWFRNPLPTSTGIPCEGSFSHRVSITMAASRTVAAEISRTGASAMRSQKAAASG